jgi:hypothetical protein
MSWSELEDNMFNFTFLERFLIAVADGCNSHQFLCRDNQYHAKLRDPTMDDYAPCFVYLQLLHEQILSNDCR